MTDDLVILREKPEAKYMIAGWRRQWSDGGEISSGLPRYLIDKLGAREIGEFGPEVGKLCFPFQVPGTHGAYRPRVAYEDGLPSRAMHRRNYFFYVEPSEVSGDGGLIIFLGEEPWMRLDIYGQAFFSAVKQLGIQKTAAVEGYNGAAPPDVERNVSCVYSQPHMKEELDRYALRYSNYGSRGRSGPTIGMALISIAHDQHPCTCGSSAASPALHHAEDPRCQCVEMFRLGAMAPMFPFLTSNNEPVGITRDHRAFYDIMRRLKFMFNLDVDLSELLTLADNEGRQLQESLERIASNNPRAKELIDRARADYNLSPFVEPVELDPALDRTLEDILSNMPDPSPEEDRPDEIV